MPVKCIVCAKDRKGSPVSDDFIIRFIRAIKKRLNIAQNNRLVVCKECMPVHMKRRADFEKKVVRYGGIGVILTILLLVLSFSLRSLLLGLFVILLMLLFTMTSYWPTVERTKAKETPKKRKAKK